MALHRLFVALRPPAAIRAALLDASKGISGARRQDDQQLHCTLRFIGEVDRHRARDIEAALGGIAHPTMALTLGLAGTFDRAGRVDTLWAGLGPFEDLDHLRRKVERALSSVGIAAERRAFVPHITLARFARGASVAPTIAALLRIPTGAMFEAGHFELIESHLGAEGASYETIARYRLR